MLSKGENGEEMLRRFLLETKQLIRKNGEKIF